MANRKEIGWQRLLVFPLGACLDRKKDALRCVTVAALGSSYTGPRLRTRFFFSGRVGFEVHTWLWID